MEHARECAKPKRKKNSEEEEEKHLRHPARQPEEEEGEDDGGEDRNELELYEPHSIAHRFFSSAGRSISA